MAKRGIGAGFTLIEMMVVLAVMSILLSLAVPAMSGVVMSIRLTAATNSFLSNLWLARSEAIKRNQTITLCRTASATATDCADGAEWVHWIVVNGAGTVLRRGSVSGAGSTIFVSSTLADARLSFRGSGVSDVAPGEDALRVCAKADSNNISTLTIGVAGRINLVKSAGGC